MKPHSLLALLVLPVLGVSCKSNDPYAAGADPYASYGADSGYNPYGTTPTAPTYPQYQAPPTSAPDPYAYQAPPTPEPSYSPPPSYSAPASSSSKSHTVVRGDTLYSLSRRYGTSVSAIKSANGLSSDLIVIGQRLSIP